MKTRKLIFALTLITILFITNLFGITQTNVQAAKPKLNKTKVSIEVGNTYTLKLNNNSKKIKWSSSNKKIATVNSKGKITAKKVGTVTVTAKVASKKYTCKVTIKKQNPYYLMDDEVVLTKGNHIYLNLCSDSGTSTEILNQGIKWTSGNKKLVTVDKYGVIKGKKAGTTTVTAKYKNKKYTCKVIIREDKTLYEDNTVKVSIDYMAKINKRFINESGLSLKVKNKTNKAFYFCLENIGINGVSEYSFNKKSTLIIAKTQDSIYHWLRPVKVSEIKTISGFITIKDINGNIISKIDFSDFKIK